MKSIATMLIAFSGLGLPAQARIISGQVLSHENSQPVEGVTVTVKGSTKTSGTQADGVYYINVDDTDSVLVFTLPEFQSKEVRISSGSQPDVRLERREDVNRKNSLQDRSNDDRGFTDQTPEDENPITPEGKPMVIEGHIYFEKTSQPAEKVHIYIVEGEEESLTDKDGYFRIETWQKPPYRITAKNYQQPPLKYSITDPSIKQVLWIR